MFSTMTHLYEDYGRGQGTALHKCERKARRKRSPADAKMVEREDTAESEPPRHSQAKTLGEWPQKQ